jgi:hypothetical protein
MMRSDPHSRMLWSLKTGGRRLREEAEWRRKGEVLGGHQVPGAKGWRWAVVVSLEMGRIRIRVRGDVA